jgi:hypothetical protein
LANGTNGSNSSIVGVNSYYAIGGGGGGTTGSGLSGGSGGGGGGISASSTSGGASIQNSTYYYGVGFSGGAGNTGYSAAGGGGAGAAGTSGTASGAAGAGGVGLAYNFANGTSVYYAGGGGGSGGGSTSGSGGNGGGGAGAGTGVGASGYNGSIGTGGGGGGAWYGSAGNGGSGTVILSYPLPQNWTGGIVTNNNGANVVHTFNTSSTLTALSTPIDTYFNYNTLLLHGDGTSGSNNSVFLDSSSNTYIPFDGTYSNYFNGSTTYLSTTLTGNTPGTGSVTYECWFHTISAAATQILMNSRSGNTTDGVDIQIRSGKIAVTYTNTILYTGTATINANTWYHLAVVRNGASNWSVYINGVLDGTFVSSVNITSTTFTNGVTPTQSGVFNGYISNCRVTNSAVYTSAPFTVPTAPLDAISNTVYLSCQSSIIKDNSVNGYTITNNGGVVISAGGNAVARNGTVTQGTFSPFATTGWSNYFNGSTDNLNLATTYALPTSTTSFTLECWVYPITQLSGTCILSAAYPGSGNIPFTIVGATSFSTSTTGSSLLAGYYNGSSWTGIQSSTSLTLNQWSHIALSYNGTTATLYLNGTSIGTYTGVWSTAAIQSTFYVGRRWDTTGTPYFNGYISNVRFVEGTAVYTGNFTPPILPLTAISGTKWLTSQSNRFVDNSSSPLTITTSGSPQVQPFSPFSPTAAYSNIVVGGSTYSTATTDYLAISGGVPVPADGQFTLEAWAYTTLSGIQVLYSQYLGGQAARTQFSIDNSSGYKLALAYGASTLFGTTVVPLNQWNHIAYTRDASNNLRIFLNGNLEANSANFTFSFYQGSPRVIGSATSPTVYPWVGYISNLRISNTCVYTASFTPPTSPVTATANTTFLLNSTNAGIIDSSQKNTLTTYGSAAVSNTQSKFGNTSISFNGSTDYILADTNQAAQFGSGDFTVETWVYFSALGANKLIVESWNSAQAASWQLYYSNTDTKIRWLIGTSTTVLTSSTTPSTGTWYHVAVARSGTSIKMFINGTQEASNTNSTAYSSTAPLAVGVQQSTSTNYLNGYIDDLRITKGIARYTTNFTPPTSAFLNQ